MINNKHTAFPLIALLCVFLQHMYLWSSAAIWEISLCIHRGPPTPLSCSLIRPHVSSEEKKKIVQKVTLLQTNREALRGKGNERGVYRLHWNICKRKSWMVATPCAWKRRDTVTKTANYLFFCNKKEVGEGALKSRETAKNIFQGDFCIISPERLIPFANISMP